LTSFFQRFVPMFSFEWLPGVAGEAGLFGRSAEQRLVVTRVGIVTPDTFPIRQGVQDLLVEPQLRLVMASETESRPGLDQTEHSDEPMGLVARPAILSVERLVLDTSLELREVMAAHALTLLRETPTPFDLRDGILGDEAGEDQKRKKRASKAQADNPASSS
jgi:hypothetical protein